MAAGAGGPAGQQPASLGVPGEASAPAPALWGSSVGSARRLSWAPVAPTVAWSHAGGLGLGDRLQGQVWGGRYCRPGERCGVRAAGGTRRGTGCSPWGPERGAVPPAPVRGTDGRPQTRPAPAPAPHLGEAELLLSRHLLQGALGRGRPPPPRRPLPQPRRGRQEQAEKQEGAQGHHGACPAGAALPGSCGGGRAAGSGGHRGRPGAGPGGGLRELQAGRARVKAGVTGGGWGSPRAGPPGEQRGRTPGRGGRSPQARGSRAAPPPPVVGRGLVGWGRVLIRPGGAGRGRAAVVGRS